MPNIDNLIDAIQQNLNTNALQETAYFSTLDLKYAHSQLNLDPETARHSNFNIIGGEGTCTCRFITGFYGLTDMPAALDDDNLRINLPKSYFAKPEILWLGHKFNQSGIAPLESKTSAILNLSAPKNLKQLRSFLGSVHYLGKFIPKISQLCDPLRQLLKKNKKFFWNDEPDTHFQSIKIKVANATENAHYNPHLETRIKFDASRAGLGAALEQRSPTGWHTVAFASRLLNSIEEGYSINELELLGVVWSVEYFKYYFFGKSFTIITDHGALLSIMKEHRSNKSYNSLQPVG